MHYARNLMHVLGGGLVCLEGHATAPARAGLARGEYCVYSVYFTVLQLVPRGTVSIHLYNTVHLILFIHPHCTPTAHH